MVTIARLRHDAAQPAVEGFAHLFASAPAHGAVRPDPHATPGAIFTSYLRTRAQSISARYACGPILDTSIHIGPPGPPDLARRRRKAGQRNVRIHQFQRRRTRRPAAAACECRHATRCFKEWCGDAAKRSFATRWCGQRERGPDFLPRPDRSCPGLRWIAGADLLAVVLRRSLRRIYTAMCHLDGKLTQAPL